MCEFRYVRQFRASRKNVQEGREWSEKGDKAERDGSSQIELMVSRLKTDWFMFALAAGLALFGALMVYSASAMIAVRETAGASQFTYFYKQFAFTLAGLAVMFAASRVDYRRLEASVAVYGIFALTVLMLIAVFAFPEINGARRWIRIGPFSIQPSEMAKIALPIFLAYFLTRNEDRVGELKSTV